MKCSLALLASLAVVALSLLSGEASADHGHGHGHKSGSGTACIVKGSYCNCHYCKCEKGWVHCGYGKHGHGEQSDFFDFFFEL